MSNAGSVAHALTLAAAGVDCVVIQGSDAGGHTHPGASAFAVLPEARDALDAAGHADVLLAYAGGQGRLFIKFTRHVFVQLKVRTREKELYSTCSYIRCGRYT